jgi:hypothetical protein
MIYAIILFAFLFTVIGAARARRVNLRTMPAYEAIKKAAFDAVETGRSVHISFGGSALREGSTLTAISTAEILYVTASRTLMADRPTYATLSDQVTHLLALDTLRKAYSQRAKLVQYQDTQARWYPQGEHSLAFAAGAANSILEQDVATNILVGRFGAEMILIAEASTRANRAVIAQSDRIDGQAVAFAVSDVPFIGEELFASAAYLSREPIAIGGVVAQDIMRYLVIFALIGLAALAFTGGIF